MVKSGYHMARLILKEDSGVGESSRRLEEGLIWQRLWKSKLPNKIKVFGWRACQDILPTKENLT